MKLGFCPDKLEPCPGSRADNGEWDEANRAKLENLVIKEHEPSRRLSDAELERVWSYDDEDFNPQHFPEVVRDDEEIQELLRHQLENKFNDQSKNQLKRRRPEAEDILGHSLDEMDRIESSSMQGLDLDVARFRRSSKRAKRSGELHIVGNSKFRSIPNKASGLCTQLQIPEVRIKMGQCFEIWEDPEPEPNTNIGTENQSSVPPESGNKDGSESDAMHSRVLQPLSHVETATYSPPLITEQDNIIITQQEAHAQSSAKENLDPAIQRNPLEQSTEPSNDINQGNSNDAGQEAESQSMSNAHSNVAVVIQCEPPEKSAEPSNDPDVMGGIEARPMSDVDGDAAIRRQPSKLSSEQSGKGERGGKGALRKKGSKAGHMKNPTTVTVGAPSVKKTKAKKEKSVTPQWLHSLLEQPRQTRSGNSKILCELDAQCLVVPTQLRRSQRNGRS